MIIVQANLGRGVPTDEFVMNFKRVMRASGNRGLVNLQEIDEADLPQEMDIVLELSKRTHIVYGENIANPILVPKRLDVVEHAVTRACNGLAKYTPHRNLNKVVVRLENDIEVADLNLHLPINRPATLSRRRQCRQHLREHANRHPNGFWVSDTNTRVGWPRIVKGEKRLHNAGIDKAKAWSKDPSVRLTVGRTSTIPLTMDGHNCHVSRAYWQNRAA
jgi:hypothetical protein